MRYVAAYLLAVLGGKTTPSQNEIEKILSSVGIEADAEKLKKVISELNGKSIDDVIAQGREKLSSMPVGGAAPAAAAAAAPAGAPAAEEKKEDKKAAKEESESEDDDMGFGLFD
ncbi:large ribosomal subunit protein P2 isoform X1 [Prorops nasuta]